MRVGVGQHSYGANIGDTCTNFGDTHLSFLMAFILKSWQERSTILFMAIATMSNVCVVIKMDLCVFVCFKVDPFFGWRAQVSVIYVCHFLCGVRVGQHSCGANTVIRAQMSVIHICFFLCGIHLEKQARALHNFIHGGRDCVKHAC